jgi:hypothetical protein
MAAEMTIIREGERSTGLTARGSAVVALLRFERLLRELGPADRRWFAGELAGLAEEATSPA